MRGGRKRGPRFDRWRSSIRGRESCGRPARIIRSEVCGPGSYDAVNDFPKLDPFTEITDRILQDDSARPKKQRHTSKRVFERLRDEHDFAGGITIVKDYVHAAGINRGIGAIWGRRGRDLEILSGVPGAGKIRTELVCGPVVSDRGGAPRNPALNWNVEWKNDREDGS